MHLDLKKTYLITDEGFISFIKSGIPENLRILDIS